MRSLPVTRRVVVAVISAVAGTAATLTVPIGLALTAYSNGAVVQSVVNKGVVVTADLINDRAMRDLINDRAMRADLINDR